MSEASGGRDGSGCSCGRIATSSAKQPDAGWVGLGRSGSGYRPATATDSGVEQNAKVGSPSELQGVDPLLLDEMGTIDDTGNDVLDRACGFGSGQRGAQTEMRSEPEGQVAGRVAVRVATAPDPQGRQRQFTAVVGERIRNEPAAGG